MWDIKLQIDLSLIAKPQNHCLMYKRQYMKNWAMASLPNERPKENMNNSLNFTFPD